MLDKIKTLICNNDICVLATAGSDGPHTSLMAYVCSDDGTQLYLITAKQSLKYKNLMADSRVSLLVDTRQADPRGAIRAITITGRAEEVLDPGEQEALKGRIRQKHPHLHGLMARPDLALIRVQVQALQMLDGVQEAHYVRLDDDGAIK